MENAPHLSPLALGIIYASEGLLDNAAREFQKEIVKNPRNNPARKLKASLSTAQKLERR